MKKQLLLKASFLFSLIFLISCSNENQLIEDNSILTNKEDESFSSRMAEALDVEKLIDNSILIDTYVSPIFEVDYKLFDTQHLFFNDISKEDNIVQAIIIFEDCKNETIGIGEYTFSPEYKNLNFNFYLNQHDYAENHPSKSYKVNDILIDDVMYIRDMNYKGCGVSVFYSDKWNEFDEFNFETNYNDLRLEAGIYPADAEIGEEATGCGWTPNCLRTSGNQCRGHSCGTVSCGVAHFETALVERQYPNYIYYITDVVLDEQYYKLRDEILLESNLGKKYVNIFYKIQDHLVETLDLDLIGEILSGLPRINNAIENFLDPSYEGVIVNSELESMVNRILSKSIEKTSSEVYKDAISKLSSDLNLLVNKDKARVIQIMEDYK